MSFHSHTTQGLEYYISKHFTEPDFMHWGQRGKIMPLTSQKPVGVMQEGPIILHPQFMPLCTKLQMINSTIRTYFLRTISDAPFVKSLKPPPCRGITVLMDFLSELNV